MNARFFYAAPIFTNSPKLMVLTEDSVLYSEHYEFDVIETEKNIVENYSSFSVSDYESEDFPIILEIDFEEAKSIRLNGESNWIERYVADRSISAELAMQA